MELTKDSSMWNTGEPSGPEECVDMWSSAKYALDNIPCSWKVAVLCEVWLKYQDLNICLRVCVFL